MKQSLKQLHQRVTPKLKPIELLSLIKEGLSLKPPFKEAIQFVNTFYSLIPPIWMQAFSDASIMKLLLNEIKPIYIPIILKYSQVDPYELKPLV